MNPKYIIMILLTCMQVSHVMDLSAQTRIRTARTGELKVGDKLTYFELNENDVAGSGLTNLGQLNGKLIILDFWNIHCPDCISAFPHMLQLQKTFGEKIQVILVNET